MLLVFAFDRAHRGGDQHHAGIGLKPLVIDEADLLVRGLLVLQAKLHPCRLFGSASSGAGSRSGRSSRAGAAGSCCLGRRLDLPARTANVRSERQEHMPQIMPAPPTVRNVFHRSIDEFITDLSSFLRAPIQPALDLGLPRIPCLGSIPEMRRRRGWAWRPESFPIRRPARLHSFRRLTQGLCRLRPFGLAAPCYPDNHAAMRKHL